MKMVPVLLFLSFVLPVFGKETVLGAWRDRAGSNFERLIQIVETEKGLVQRSTFSTGEVVNRPLEEKTKKGEESRIFFVSESSRRDGCLINKDGDLQLFDSEGMIRIARKAAEVSRLPIDLV